MVQKYFVPYITQISKKNVVINLYAKKNNQYKRLNEKDFHN